MFSGRLAPPVEKLGGLGHPDPPVPTPLFIMAYGYIKDLSAADKERHMEKVRDFTKNAYENLLDPLQD